MADFLEILYLQGLQSELIKRYKTNFSKIQDWKSCERDERSGGSNPLLSAKIKGFRSYLLKPLMYKMDFMVYKTNVKASVCADLYKVLMI